MMKALFVHDHIFYDREGEFYSAGGLPSSAWSRYLESVDHIYVVSRGSQNEEKSGLIKSSTTGVEFDLFYQVRGGLDYYKYRSVIIRRLRSYIEKVDFVIIRVPSTIGYFAYRLCRELNKPYVSEVVGCAWDSSWNYGTFLVKLQAPLGFMRMKAIVKNSIAVSYVTEFFLQKRYPTDATIITYASNVQIPESDDSIRDSHISLIRSHSVDRTLKIGMIGNLAVKYKGFDIAIKALSRLRDYHPEIKFNFLVVGGGDKKYVNSLIIKSNLVGYCSVVGRLEAGDEVFEFLDKLDLYIHPSKQEGLPRAVIEAMSRACPILASSVAGIPELIDYKYLHRPGDSKKLYSDLYRVLTNEEELIKMSWDNFERSQNYYQQTLEKRRVNFYKKITDLVLRQK